jgi:hypothetical protein
LWASSLRLCAVDPNRFNRAPSMPPVSIVRRWRLRARVGGNESLRERMVMVVEVSATLGCAQGRRLLERTANSKKTNYSFAKISFSYGLLRSRIPATEI